jgi:hypothetical protein
MSSLRRLNRRLRAWDRYERRYRHVAGWDRLRVRVGPGLVRAEWAVHAEEERRFWAETPEIWLGGREGEAALIADVADDRCCLAGDACHDGPCVIRCDGCNGNGACPECGGVDDLGCWHCDGSGGCPRHCDDGEIVLTGWAAS